MYRNNDVENTAQLIHLMDAEIWKNNETYWLR